MLPHASSGFRWFHSEQWPRRACRQTDFAAAVVAAVVAVAAVGAALAVLLLRSIGQSLDAPPATICFALLADPGTGRQLRRENRNL